LTEKQQQEQKQQQERTSESVIAEYLQLMNREINPSKDYLRITKLVLSKIDVMTATEEDI
jgi:hypothetical protein